MTTDLQAELFRDLSIIAENENLMLRLMKYVKKLASTQQQDDSRLTKEEFLDRVDKARQGPSITFDSVDDLDQYIRNQY